MTVFPDTIIKLMPDYCRSCGSSLEEKSPMKGKSRQIVDIPPIKAIYTEYQSFIKVCSCGCQNTADFPQEVNAPVSYGGNVESLIAYFHTRQYWPFARMKETFNDVFGLPISEGGIHFLLKRFAQKTGPIYQTIKYRIQVSPVIGTDETGAKVNGNKHWFWAWQIPNITFISHSNNRGSETINREFPEGFPQSTLVHYGWRAQLNTVSKNHQASLAHLQRRLNYLNQLYPSQKWGTKFLKLLYDSLEINKWDFQSQKYNSARASIIQRFEFLLDNSPKKEQKELYTFYKRMRRERQDIFTFLFLFNVPPDNNASERVIRNIKVKQKISGQFKIEQATQNFDP